MPLTRSSQVPVLFPALKASGVKSRLDIDSGATFGTGAGFDTGIPARQQHQPWSQMYAEKDFMVDPYWPSHD